MTIEVAPRLFRNETASSGEMSCLTPRPSPPPHPPFYLMLRPSLRKVSGSIPVRVLLLLIAITHFEFFFSPCPSILLFLPPVLKSLVLLTRPTWTRPAPPSLLSPEGKNLLSSLFLSLPPTPSHPTHTKNVSCSQMSSGRRSGNALPAKFSLYSHLSFLPRYILFFLFSLSPLPFPPLAREASSGHLLLSLSLSLPLEVCLVHFPILAGTHRGF